MYNEPPVLSHLKHGLWGKFILCVCAVVLFPQNNTNIVFDYNRPMEQDKNKEEKPMVVSKLTYGTTDTRSIVMLDAHFLGYYE